MKRFVISALDFYTTILRPIFGDEATSALGFNGTLNEFTVMDNVVSSKPIIDIRRAQNIMQRRDASCDIVYKNLFGASTRKVTTTELYAAVKFCKNEFYQGCLKEWRNNDPLFKNNILPYFRNAVNTDLTTNAYFGDVDRNDNPAAQFSTTMFDGVFKWIKKYQAAGVIPAGQTIAIADGTDFTATPSTAYNIIKGLYDKRPALMRTFTDDQQAFYVSPEIADGYEDHLVATGSGNTSYINDIQTGRKVPAYKGIRILKEPLWTPVISEIKGSAGYAAILTLRGNFVYATDKAYGEDDGTGKDVALIIWYDQEHFTWKYQMFLKAGTQIALPEFLTYALTAFV